MPLQLECVARKYKALMTEDPLKRENEPSTSKPSATLIMVETAFMASTASLLWLINYYIPLGPVLRILFPIPIALLYLRTNSRAAWMSVLVSGLLLSVLMGPFRTIVFIVPFALLGVQFGACWRRGASWLTSIALGTLIGNLGLFFRFWLFSILLGEDLWRYVINLITGILQWVFLNLGILAQPNVWIVQIVAIIFITLSNILYAFTVHLAAYLLFERMGQPMPQPPAWVDTLIES